MLFNIISPTLKDLIDIFNNLIKMIYDGEIGASGTRGPGFTSFISGAGSVKPPVL